MASARPAGRLSRRGLVLFALPGASLPMKRSARTGWVKSDPASTRGVSHNRGCRIPSRFDFSALLQRTVW